MNIHPRTSLQSRQPYTPWNDEEIRANAAKLWHQSGTVMIKPEWLNNTLDREHLIQMANLIHGKRTV